MKKQKKWPHFIEGRSEICVEAIKEYFSLRKFIPFSKGFRKKNVINTIYFYTNKLSKIYFWVFPSDISTPNNFRLLIDSIRYAHLPDVKIFFNRESYIEFDKDYSISYAKNPIQIHFPSPGLATICYRILAEDGTKPLDKKGKEILLAQRNLSDSITDENHDKETCNVGQIPIIIIDYHSKILIKLNWLLIALTAVLTVLTILLIIKGG